MQGDFDTCKIIFKTQHSPSLIPFSNIYVIVHENQSVCLKCKKCDWSGVKIVGKSVRANRDLIPEQINNEVQQLKLNFSF